MNEDFESNILGKLSIPHAFFPQDTISQKKALAWHTASLSGEEVLLASSFAFSYEGIIAGLTVSQIEYFSKNAPISFKKELINSILNEDVMKEVFEIVKMMDDDMGNGVTQNQKRIKDVRQYVLDNLVVFQF
jgi:hypothetical protein